MSNKWNRIVAWFQNLFGTYKVEEQSKPPARDYHDEDDEHTAPALNLSPIPRPLVPSSSDSNEAAKSLLADAYEKAKEKEPGKTVVATLSDDYRHVSRLELIASLHEMTTVFKPEEEVEADFHLMLKSQFNNDYTFIKL